MIAKEGVKAELWAEKWYDSEFIGGTWNLAYTTEKEVLSLIGDPGSGTFAVSDLAVTQFLVAKSSGFWTWGGMPQQVSAGVDVYQKVDVEQGTLGNSALVAMFPW